ncbi:VMAP-C domain-containing protein [Thermomonospora amylolytica]|uniref:VMAP-C domain-containing protein n=1 Tax=Thermomonospora amylolytica TaxID=1411117 RepID=UPI0022780468|nr:hypothetical protein [Thermomonospora amylolytica]
MTQSLSVNDQWRLVNALLEVDEIRRRESRDDCILRLEDSLGHRLPIKRDDRDLYDVLQLVRCCLAYPGAVHELASIVAYVHGEGRAVHRINELVGQLLPEPLLTVAERRELHGLLDEWRTHADDADLTFIAELYRQAAGPLAPPPDIAVGDLGPLIAQLEEATFRPDGMPPLLVFVEALAAHTDDDTTRRLDGWSEGVAGRLGPRRRSRRELGARIAGALEPGGRCSYLIIEFRPDAMAADRYLPSAWLQVDGEHGVMLRCDDEDPLPAERLRGVIEDLLTDPQVVNRPGTDLVVEFVLPRSLLGLPLDQIPITIEGLERRLGIEYPVVVRSFDRMRSRILHHNWRRKWNWLRDNPARAGLCRLPRRGNTGHERLYNTLVSENSAVCVALGFPPRTDHDQPDELWVGLHAGMPIALWCRRRREPGRFFAEIEELWRQGALSLPQNVLELRRKALRALDEAPVDDHLGFELTLMFDDADRLPEPYVRLSAPA